MTHDRDTSSDTTVPHLVAGPIPVYVGEEEPPRLAHAHRYGIWAFLPEAALAPARPERRKAKTPGTPRHHLVHVPSGRTVATVSNEGLAEELARALSARCPSFCSSCSLGDTPDDGEEIHAMVVVVAEVAPSALLPSGELATRLAQSMSLAQRLDDAGAFDVDTVDEGVAA